MDIAKCSYRVNVWSIDFNCYAAVKETTNLEEADELFYKLAEAGLHTTVEFYINGELKKRMNSF